MQQGSSSASSEKQHDTSNVVGNKKASEDELTCSVCLEQVNIGELLHSLPCLHQTAECLMCLQNWIGPTTNTIESKELLEELIHMLKGSSRVLKFQQEAEGSYDN